MPDLCKCLKTECPILKILEGIKNPGREIKLSIEYQKNNYCLNEKGYLRCYGYNSFKKDWDNQICIYLPL